VLAHGQGAILVMLVALLTLALAMGVATLVLVYRERPARREPH
jgi:hypothetical protein